MKSQRNLVILPLILANLACLLANKTSPAPQTVSSTRELLNNSPFSSTLSPIDEEHGDDGSQLRKDFEELNRTVGGGNSHTDMHQFYMPEYIKDPERAMSFWVDFSKLPANQSQSSKHEMLSKSYRRAAPIKLNFDFPFYGQPLRNIIIATGGFLYVGEHIHHWLAATQNISPLMANFDLSKSNSSDIYHYDNGTALVVQWHEVQMKDDKPPGNFSFQVTLHKNGDIVFVYKSLPAPIAEIPENEHPVKVGISDAFLIDKTTFFIRRKTIYDYHRLNLKDVPTIKSQSAIYLKALPTCNQFETCETCAKAASNLECIWCPVVKRCSNGFDRKRQDWLQSQCDKIQKSDCSVKTEPSVQPQSSSSSSNQMITVDQPIANRQMIPDRGGDSRAAEGGTAFVTFLMFLALTSGIAFWAFYAYKNPHTPSGQLLIKYRPSNWRWQNAETRYTAASIHM